LLGSAQQFTARHVEDVLDLARKSRSGSRIELPGMLVRKVFARLEFSVSHASAVTSARNEFTGQTCEYEYAIALPDSSKSPDIVVPEIQRRFNLKMIDWPSSSGETTNHRGALAFDKLRWPLLLRNWRPGDCYRPLGHRNVRKLKRLILESRIPWNSRAGWPVLTSGEKLVWASGCPVAQDFAATSTTQTGVVVVEEHLHRTTPEP